MLKKLLFSTLVLGGTVTLNAQCLQISCNSNMTTPNDAAQCGAVVSYTTPAIISNTCAGSIADTFNFTGSMQTYVVPAGVTSVRIETWGAQGGANWVNNTNFGGYVAADVTVTPGSTLYVYVGGQATTITGGFNGGGNGEGAGKGGGGASDVRIGGTTYNDRVVVAGGGGGAGYWSSLHVVGGEGGGLVGNNGYRDPNYATNPGGQGGTQTSSGTGTCVSFNNPSVAGGFGYGGTPSGCGCEGYGGGGGWWGGAGSGNCRGGGGGSGYAIPSATNVSMTTGGHAGNGMVVISYSGPSVATVSQVSGLPSGSLFPQGLTTNTFIASDQFGNADTCTFTVYVTDTEVPVLSNVPSNISLNADSGMCNTTVTWTVPTVTDNCATTLTSNYSSGAVLPVGTTTVTYIVSDVEGNADTVSFDVTINDVEAPVISGMPGDTTIANDPGQCTAVVNWSPATATDNCSVISLTASANSGDAFPVGTTTVTYIAIDSTGNADTASFTITVLDTEVPTAVCPSGVTVNADSGQCSATNVTLGSVSAMDNCGVTIVDDAPSVYPVGSTTITYLVSDPSGNTVSCQQTVTVLDVEAPEFISCGMNTTICPGVIIYNTPEAMDNCSATVSYVSGPQSGDSLTAGTYTVVYVATDSSGNTDTCSFVVTVVANPTVTLSLPFSTVCVDDGAYTLQGGAPAGGTWSGPVSGNTLTPSTAGTGTHAITYTYTDANGCFNSATDTVVISACVGISESGAQSFTMFPNPATDNFVFSATEQGTMEMFDANGKRVYAATITSAQTEVNVSEFATGTYLVRFTGDSGTVSNGKLIIQK